MAFTIMVYTKKIVPMPTGITTRDRDDQPGLFDGYGVPDRRMTARAVQNGDRIRAMSGQNIGLRFQEYDDRDHSSLWTIVNVWRDLRDLFPIGSRSVTRLVNAHACSYHCGNAPPRPRFYLPHLPHLPF
jgi:hypothetical protein